MGQILFRAVLDLGYSYPSFEIAGLKRAVTGARSDVSFRLDFYRISTKNQTFDWS